MKPQRHEKHILWFTQINKKDVPLVGGKNASLGEMFSRLRDRNINVPDGFVLTAEAYWYYLRFNKIDKKLKKIFKKFNPDNILSLRRTGKLTRSLILKGEFPNNLKEKILKNYRELSRRYKTKDVDVAVRSSATAEDLPDASFAGQHETYLNVSGEENLLAAIKKCLASLFTDRAIIYREEKGFNQLKIALSVGIQKMVRSDLASSGVMFTMDTESGFPNVVLINSIFGVGEMIVKGKIIPDEFYVFKPTLEKGFPAIILKNLGRKTKKYIYARNGGLKDIGVAKTLRVKFSLSDKEILTLARWACLIEKHYERPQDIEWAKDGRTGQLFIIQARPETIHSKQKTEVFEDYQIKSVKKPILTGAAIGEKIGFGRIRLISNISQLFQFQKGEILVTKMTDPDWLPIMRIASAVITEEGGKTCHAAIVARELGIPAVVGAGGATGILKNGQTVTVDCSGGTGRIFPEKIPFKIKKYNLRKIPRLPVKIMVNIGAPEIAFKNWSLPVDGVGLARIEFILAEKIRVHPLALYRFKELKNKGLKKKIAEITAEHRDKKEYFIKELAEGIAQIASAFYPKPVIVRLSDLKSNEYRALIGGKFFEPIEANPMLGWRGASRYYDEKFKPAFEMECRAIKRTREVFGLKNIWLMVPFCRTLEEGKKVLQLMKKNGLEKGKNGLKVIVMCEIPSNVILAEEFLEIFDGMSIGSNDLTQLVLGLDRDSALISKVGDERNEAVKEMIKKAIKLCREKKKYCGICGDIPSSDIEFARFLEKEGIQTISLSPDAVIKTILRLVKKS